MSALVAVITAAGGVSDDVLDALRPALGGGAPLRLGPGAAEISGAEADGAALEGLRSRFSVDINLVPARARLKQILIADMDSTIIGVECIDELADFAGVKVRVAAVTERAMRGELDFEAAIFERVALLEGLPVSVLEECYSTRVALNPGAKVLVAAMNAAGAETALVSGGFTYFTERVAAEAGFATHQANRLEVEDGRLTGRVRLPVLGQAAKAEALARLCAARGLGPEAAVAIGDGANDLAMIRMAGLGVAYRAKPALRAEADAVLDHSDLTAVLALQGIAA